jgi:hypothetical protein
MAYQFSHPYWYENAKMTGNTFRKEYIYPGDDSTWPKGCVTVYCDENVVGQLPWTWCVYSTQGIVERLWPDSVATGYYK